MQDIRYGVPSSSIVVGFFTPNYEKLALGFSENLQCFGIAHHLYTVEQTDWHAGILMKPCIVERARLDYPCCSIISMDVDCIVRGNLEPELKIDADVGLAFSEIREKNPRLYPGTRVSVWNPTPGAARLLARWRDLCKAAAIRNDEILLMQAISDVEKVSISSIPKSHKGSEIDKAPGNAVVVHRSAYRNEKNKNLRKRFLRWSRNTVSIIILGVTADDAKHGKRLS